MVNIYRFGYLARAADSLVACWVKWFVVAVAVGAVVAVVGEADVGAIAFAGTAASVDPSTVVVVGSNCPYFSVGVVTFAVAVDLGRMEGVVGSATGSVSGDSADFHRFCIALLVLHHCCPVGLDLDMVAVPLEPTIKKKAGNV